MLRQLLGLLVSAFLFGCGFERSIDVYREKIHEGDYKATFSVKNGRLVDPSGHDFLIRGVNSPHAYYRDPSFRALDRISGLGFNTVRILWCADTLLRSGRCDPKDMHSLDELQKLLKRLRELRLVGVLQLHNATGSNSPDDLAKLVDWYLKPEVKALLEQEQDILLLNIANEWFGEWNDPDATYRKSYESQIARLRAGGLEHVLVIDARGWGQQFSSIPENFRELMAVDQNLLFSAHMYDQFGTNEIVSDAFNVLRREHIPALIGEFACAHYPGQTVACEKIMEEAARQDWPVGYIAWSFSGNSSPLESLDIVSQSDWYTLSPFGRTVIEHPFGVKATSRIACIYNRSECAKEGEL